MNHCRWFQVDISKTPSGRHRWLVRVQGSTVASGVAPNRLRARAAALDEQKRLAPAYGQMNIKNR